jgi:prepilin-type N-terminal cleavage/methylation domain-containing protein
MNRDDAEARGGFTLIEILVVIAVIGMLAGLTLAGVQRARESARRISCATNLRQFGLALAQHHGQTGHFPSPMPPRRLLPGMPKPTARLDEFSGLYEILPMLEQIPLYNSINLDVRGGRNATANQTSCAIQVAMFLCPSDGYTSSARPFGPLNYRFDVASPAPLSDFHDAPAQLGAFSPLHVLSAAEITDGLSSTVGMSERLVGGGSSTSFRRDRDFWYAGVYGPGPRPSPETLLTLCDSLRSAPSEFCGRFGYSWAGNSSVDAWFNHVVPPNAEIADCDAGEGKPEAALDSVLTARSLHDGGVWVLLMDGSTRFVRDGINLATWRALGTRSGGETASADF